MPTHEAGQPPKNPHSKRQVNAPLAVTPKQPPQTKPTTHDYAADPRPRPTPTTIATLKSTDLSTEEGKNRLGELVYAKLAPDYENEAARLTGMLLELDPMSLLALLEDPTGWNDTVHEALTVCKERQEEESGPQTNVVQQGTPKNDAMPTHAQAAGGKTSTVTASRCNKCSRALPNNGKCMACVVGYSNPFDEAIRKARAAVPRGKNSASTQERREGKPLQAELHPLPGLKTLMATAKQKDYIAQATEGRALVELPDSLAAFVATIPLFRNEAVGRNEFWTIFAARADNVRAELLPFMENVKGLMKMCGVVSEIHTIRHPGARTLVLLRVDTRFRDTLPKFHNHDCTEIGDLSGLSKSLILDMTFTHDYAEGKPSRNTVNQNNPLVGNTFAFPLAAMMRPNATLCYDPASERDIKKALWDNNIRAVLMVGRGKLRIHTTHSKQDVKKALATLTDWKLYDESNWCMESSGAPVEIKKPRKTDDGPTVPSTTFVLLVEQKCKHVLQHAIEDTSMIPDEVRYPKDQVPSFPGYATKLISAPLPSCISANIHMFAYTPNVTLFLLPIEEARFRERHGHSPAIQADWGDKSTTLPGGNPPKAQESQTFLPPPPAPELGESQQTQQGKPNTKRAAGATPVTTPVKNKRPCGITIQVAGSMAPGGMLNDE